MPPDILVKQEFKEQSDSEEKTSNLNNSLSSVQVNSVHQGTLNSVDVGNNIQNVNRVTSNNVNYSSGYKSIKSNKKSKKKKGK